MMPPQDKPGYFLHYCASLLLTQQNLSPNTRALLWPLDPSSGEWPPVNPQSGYANENLFR
jgi:hypothetical protein